jgi:hypothetical protein
MALPAGLRSLVIRIVEKMDPEVLRKLRVLARTIDRLSLSGSWSYIEFCGKYYCTFIRNGMLLAAWYRNELRTGDVYRVIAVLCQIESNMSDLH